MFSHGSKVAMWVKGETIGTPYRPKSLLENKL